MATKKKLLEAAAGSAGGAGLNVEEVFSTYLYDGTGSPIRITNNIDLLNEGGLVWTKARNSTYSNTLIDTVNGGQVYLYSNDTRAHTTPTTAYIKQFYSDGYQIGDSNGGTASELSSTLIQDGNSTPGYASWTFRKAPKFFDVVTYTGTGSAQNISHNLGTTVGTLIVKRTDTTGDWLVQHRSLGGTYYMDLQNTNAAATNTTYWNNTTATSTEFTVGTSSYTNASGGTYVAYLFAHNDGDGDFGPTGDQDIIKCGSYTGTGTAGLEVDLGFEPQWLLIKRSDSTSEWALMDTMRGIVSGGTDVVLRANTTNADITAYDYAELTPTGFSLTSDIDVNTNGGTYIYIAIRRGPMAVPESATEVFAPAVQGRSPTDPTWLSNFVTDWVFTKQLFGSNTNAHARLTGTGQLEMNNTGLEGTYTDATWDYMDGFGQEDNQTDKYAWMWRRAPSFCDVVAYTGNGTAGRTVSHNLGVAPEMMWIKERGNSNSWGVYHSSLGATKSLVLNSTNAEVTTTIWNSTEPSATEFTVGSASVTNRSSGTYIAYLFASLDGVSKVGSYTGNGTSQTIDCGFSSGARFVLIKRTDALGNWLVVDTERGLVSGNDPVLLLDATNAEQTNLDIVDPTSSGFIVNGTSANWNASGGSYIFYAIA